MEELNALKGGCALGVYGVYWFLECYFVKKRGCAEIMDVPETYDWKC